MKTLILFAAILYVLRVDAPKAPALPSCATPRSSVIILYNWLLRKSIDNKGFTVLVIYGLIYS